MVVRRCVLTTDDDAYVNEKVSAWKETYISMDGLKFDKEIVDISNVNKSLTLKEKMDVQQHKSKITNIPNTFWTKM